MKTVLIVLGVLALFVFAFIPQSASDGWSGGDPALSLDHTAPGASFEESSESTGLPESSDTDHDLTNSMPPDHIGDSDPASRLSVDRDTHQFGHVVEGAFVRHSFVLTNEGVAPLIITDARSVSTCPCTIVTLRDSALAAGESTTFDVIWDTAGYGGRTTGWSFSIETDDPEIPVLYLFLQGEVAPAGPHHLPIQYLEYDLYVLVDLPSPDAYTERHILGAVNIPYEVLDDYIGLLSYEYLIIFYDDDGASSYAAVERLLEEGYLPNYVVTLFRGFPAWIEAGGATWSTDPLAEESMLHEDTAWSQAFEDHSVTVQQLQRWLFAMVDIRTQDEYAAGHLAGAINIPLENLDDYLGLLPANARLVVYDEEGLQADRAVEKLLDHGITGVQSVVGGISLWREAFGTTMIWPVQ